MKIVDVRINGQINPIGYSFEALKLSWKIQGSPGEELRYTEILVALDPAMNRIVARRSGALENTGALLDLQLMPRTTYYAQVRLVGTQGQQAASDVVTFETGKRDEAWQALWIGQRPEDTFHPVFEKDIHLSRPVERARLYICGLGLYEAYIGGKKVGDDYLAPFLNSYDKALQYQTYDVTELLASSCGKERLSVLLGNGWYKGRLGYDGRSAIYGDRFALIAELWLEYSGGGVETVATGEDWTYRASDIEYSDIYDGEGINRLLNGGRDNPPRLAVPMDMDTSLLVERHSIPVRAMENLPVRQVLTTPAGETVLDFGQNFSGYVEFKAALPRGAKVVLTHGEILQGGNFYNGNYRSAKAAFTYTSDGRQELVRPHFTFTGFRYVKVDGWPGAIDKTDFTGKAVYSAMQRTGWLKTGHAKVNRLIENALWGMKSNFLDIPTDCPQRDERLAWTGDAQVFAPTAAFFMDCRAFFAKYLWDLRGDQVDQGGSVANFLPNFNHEKGGASVWGDAATFIPTTLYDTYGDKQALEESYCLMKDWVDWITRGDEGREGGARFLFDFGFSFGDWLAMDGVTSQSLKGGTEDAYISSVYYFASAQKLARAAAVLGKEQDAKAYSALSDSIKSAVLEEYFAPSGRLAVDTQAAYVIALYFGIWRQKEPLVRGLRNRLKKDGYRIKCGFVGAPLICEALADNGLERLAFHLLLQEDFPGWLHCVNLGATTIWERWNSVLSDGSVSGTGMNSLNHYAYGAVVNYIVRNIAGLQALEPGYAKVLIAPMYHPDLGHMDCAFDSAHGIYSVNWKILAGGSIQVRCEVPFGCEALLRLPGYERAELTLGPGVFSTVYKPAHDYRCLYDWQTPLENYAKDPRALEILKTELPAAYARAAGDNVEELSWSLEELKQMPWFGFIPAAVDSAAAKLFELKSDKL